MSLRMCFSHTEEVFSRAFSALHFVFRHSVTHHMSVQLISTNRLLLVQSFRVSNIFIYMHEYICTVDIFFRPYYLSENPCPSSYQCLDGSCISWSNTCSKTRFCGDGTNTPSVCGKSDLQHWTDHLRLMSYVLHSIMRPTPGNSRGIPPLLQSLFGGLFMSWLALQDWVCQRSWRGVYLA